MTKQEQIEEMRREIYYARSKVNGIATSNDIAEALYNAGYRKTFTSDLASDMQKAFKEGYEKGCETCEQAWDNGYNDGYESGKEDGVREFAEELKAKTMCIKEYEDGTRILQTSNKLIDQSVNIFLTNC
jgi:flagellar biosynthesis/type III secretory pathway protein FliH